MTNTEEQFTEWERVLVRNYESQERKEHIYLCTIPWNYWYKYICVSNVFSEKRYRNWEVFSITSFRKIEKLSTKDVTYTQGERVLARHFQEDERQECIYLCTVTSNAARKYVCVLESSVEEYEKWWEFYTNNYWTIKKLEK
jgi:hypothetical protein